MAVTHRNIDTNYRIPGVFSSAANFLLDARNGGSAVEGDQYYDTTDNILRNYNGTSWVPAGQTGTSAGSFDDVINVGSKVTIDGGLTAGVEIEATDAIISTDGALLLLDNNDTGSDVHALEITSTSTASAIQITNNTATTDDIQGTSDTWAITGQGNATFNQVNLVDDDLLRFGTSQDITMTWDQTKLVISGAAANNAIHIGDATNLDLVIYGGTTTNAITFDTDDSALTCTFNGFDLHLDDADVLGFGDSQDITINWDKTDLIVEGAAADSKILVGKTNNLDLVIYGDTSTDAITFDTSAEDCQFNGFDLSLFDDDILNFGNSDDVTISWDQTKLNVAAAAADTRLLIGGTSNGFDLEYYFETSGTIKTDYDGLVTIFDGCDIRLNDDDYLLFGDSAVGGSADGYMYWDQTNLKLNCATGRLQIDTDVQIGTATTDEENLAVYGNLTVTGSFTHTGSYNPSSIAFDDDEILSFGTGTDITVTWDQTQLVFSGAAANNAIHIGDATNLDLIIYGGTTTNAITFDTDDSALTCTFNGFDLHLDDDDVLGFGDAQDITMTWDQTNLVVSAQSADNAIHFGDATNIDVVIYGDNTNDAVTFDTSAEDIDINGFDISLNDDDLIKFGNSDDITITWDKTDLIVEGAAADSKILLGYTNNLDLVIYGDTTTDAVTFDTSAEDININGFDISLNDDDLIKFGDADDVTITWDQTNLLIESAAEDTGEVRFGSTNAIDVAHYANTNTSIAKFNANTATLEFNGYDVQIQDDDILAFGDSDDFTVTMDSTNTILLIDGAAADTVISIGKANNQDVVIYGDTSTDAITFDTSAEDCQFNGFDLTLQDDDILNFGDADDITITWNQTNLIIDGAAADKEIRIGYTNNQDIGIYGDNTNQKVVYDTSAETVTFTDFNITMSGTTSAVITCAYQSDFGGLAIPTHATSAPSGTPATASIFYEVDASKLWVHKGGGTWVGTVLS
jgi:hypothetical protein